MTVTTLRRILISQVRLSGCESNLQMLKASDLRQQYDVRLEQGLDSFVVVDGLPIVETSNKAKLQKFVTGKLSTAAFKIKPEGFYMPMGENGKSEG